MGVGRRSCDGVHARVVFVDHLRRFGRVGRGDDQTGCLTNIVVGVVGALLGGFIWGYFLKQTVVFSWSFGAFFVAVIGTIVLLLIVKLFRKV